MPQNAFLPPKTHSQQTRKAENIPVVAGRLLYHQKIELTSFIGSPGFEDSINLDLNGDFFEVILSVLPIIVVIFLQGGTLVVDVVSELVQIPATQTFLFCLDERRLLQQRIRLRIVVYPAKSIVRLLDSNLTERKNLFLKTTYFWYRNGEYHIFWSEKSLSPNAEKLCTCVLKFCKLFCTTFTCWKWNLAFFQHRSSFGSTKSLHFRRIHGGKKTSHCNSRALLPNIKTFQLENMLGFCVDTSL